ncbi:hypothetical protein [Psychromicrobium sp. YIM B11713]|uniref:hypothetical protein n=1 Tax=Psychromicrobium sp. YIM B11713 TaxID=3145233 RepID=UPI00374FACEB
MVWWPEPQNMVHALGPSDVVIDIRDAGMYEKWHGFPGMARDGLTCLDCGRAVLPRRLGEGTKDQHDILAHWPEKGRNLDADCREARATGSGLGLKRALKFAIGKHLESRGFKAEIDPARSGENIDVQTAFGIRKIAIRVELGNFSREDYLAAQERLTKQGFEVLWLTYRCNWIDKAPALGIRFDTDAPVSGSLDMGGFFPIVDNGYLLNEPTQLRQPDRHEVGLGTVLDQFMSGVIQNHSTSSQYQGWATTAAWDLHIVWLLRRYAMVRDRQNKAEAELRQATEDHHNQLRVLEKRHLDDQRLLGNLTSQLKSAQLNNGSLQEKLDRRALEQKTANDWIDEVEKRRNSSPLVRLALRRQAELQNKNDLEACTSPTPGWIDRFNLIWPWGVFAVILGGPAIVVALVVFGKLLSNAGGGGAGR